MMNHELLKSILDKHPDWRSEAPINIFNEYLDSLSREHLLNLVKILYGFEDLRHDNSALQRGAKAEKPG